jgi:hypothetical protein
MPYDAFFFRVFLALVGGTVLMLIAYPLIAAALRPAPRREGS